jgi:hypothetical protein
VTPPGRGIRRGRKPGDALIDDRAPKAESRARPDWQRFDREIAALPSPPPAPAPGPGAKPAIDAYQLVRAIATARLLRDWPTADKLLAELQRLAQRPGPRAGGEHDSIRD